MAALTFSAVDASADQMTSGPATIKQLAQSSDSVVVGKCIKKSTAMVGKNIETTYEFEVTQSLKGMRKAGSKLSVSTPGGKHPLYALAQMVPQQAQMYPNEEAALFLKEVAPGTKAKANVNKDSKLPMSPKVVGGWQGKYTVFTDSADNGKKKLVRFNMENYGYAHNDAILKKFIDAYSEGRVESGNAETIKNRMSAMSATQKAAGEDGSVLLQTPLIDVLPAVIGMDEFEKQVKETEK